MTEQELFEIIERQEQLPTLPPVITKVLNMLNHSEEVSAKDIGDVISTDISLSTKTLKIVNSAFYGFPRKISTITQAIIILGFNTIKSALFGVAVINAFDKYKKNSVIDYKNFWEHSLAVGVSSRILSKRSGYKHTEESFIAGIIHDIGKLVLSCFLSSDYKQVTDEANDKSKKIFYSDIERKYLGFDHSEVGYWLAEKWNLPEDLSSAIRYHHNPLKSPKNEYRIIAGIVSVANILADILNFGDDGSYYIEKIHEPIWNMLNLKIKDLADIYDEIKEEYKKASLFLI